LRGRGRSVEVRCLIIWHFYLVEAEATFADGLWTVTASRKLSTGDRLRKDITVGKLYPFGIAIHENYPNSRYHYVSLEHTFVLDKGTADFIVVQ
jgi:hypothetical protein